MRKTVIVSAARTPFGKFGGVLKEVKAAEQGHCDEGGAATGWSLWR